MICILLLAFSFLRTLDSQEVQSEINRYAIKDFLQKRIKVRRLIIMKIQDKVTEDQDRGQAPFKLHVGMLHNIDLSLYPKERTHYLTYALQFGLKPPSAATMNRSQARNKIKKGSDVADTATKRIPARIMQRRIAKLRFLLPNKFGPQPSRPRARAMNIKATKSIAYRPWRAIPGRKPISLPQEIIRKQLRVPNPKKTNNAFRSRAPQWLALKADRLRFMDKIEKYRANNPNKELRSTPIYFQKKKASQKRRRQQKHKLIQANRAALVEIFGDSVFKTGWPISRREIKLALGIKQEDHDQIVLTKEFMAMIEKTKEDKKVWVGVAKSEVPVFNEDDFPSLLGR